MTVAAGAGQPLPADAVWELHRLARKGHVQALRQALDEWQAAAPAHASEWQLLGRWVDDFELDALVARLAPQLTEDTADEPRP